MRVHPISQGTRHASSNIEWNSVNSILLDAEPENSNDRLIVAGFVSTNENGENLSLRETTLMPNIGGLVGILCLLFAPSAELRVNKYETKITGAVCGLGYDPITKRPYNPTNDIEVVFDAEIDNNDIKLINNLRYYLNKLFQNMGGDEFRNLLPKKIRVKELLLNLLTRRRHFQNLMPRAKAFTWGCIPSRRLIPVDEGHADDIKVFEYYTGVLLEEHEPPEVRNEMRKNLLELYKVAKGDIKDRSDGVCKLCNNVEFKNRKKIEMHLLLPYHRQKEKKMFKMNLENFPEVRNVIPALTQGRSQAESYGQVGVKFDCPTPRGRGRGKQKSRHWDPNIPGPSRN